MLRFGLLVAIVLSPGSLSAQSESKEKPASPPDKILGAELKPVPAMLRAHLPNLPKQYGLYVAGVTEESIAAKMGLQRYDVVVLCDKIVVRDAPQLVDLLVNTSNKVDRRLTLYRAGKKYSLSFPPRSSTSPTETLPLVRLRAKPLPAGRFKVTLTYYATENQKQTFTWEATPSNIDKKVQKDPAVQKLSPDMQDLLQTAIRRFQKLNKK